MSIDPKLGALKSRIQKAETALKPLSPQKASSQGLVSRFFHVGVELISGILVGAGLGILVDTIFGVSPWGVIVFFILGSAAGLLNVYRVLTSQRPRPKD